MTTYVLRHGNLIEKHSPSSAEAPYVISDIMDSTRHMVTGRYYDSKSKFREVTKATGCVEVGNDPAISRPRKSVPLSREQRREDIKRTMYQMRNGR